MSVWDSVCSWLLQACHSLDIADPVDISFPENGRLCSTARSRHLWVAGGPIPGPGSSICRADWCVDGSVQWWVRLGRFRAAVQRASSVHGVGPSLPARRW